MKTMIDLTDRLPFKIDLDKMREEVAYLEQKHNWVGHYDKFLADGWTAVPLVSHDGSMDKVDSQRLGKWGQYKRTPIVDSLPYFRSILDSFQCPHGRIRIMRMNPGTVIKPHRDVFQEVACYAFKQVRLHIPIFTNDKVVFVVGGTDLKLQPGHLYYVNFSKLHHVRNDGDAVRTHLVLDLKVDDWLAGIFPELSAFEKVENFVVRNTLPAFWHAEEACKIPSRLFWKLYDGSWVQNAYHRIRASRA